MDGVEILSRLLDYGLAGLALYLIYNLTYHRISKLEAKLEELIREIRTLREEIRIYFERERK